MPLIRSSHDLRTVSAALIETDGEDGVDALGLDALVSLVRAQHPSGCGGMAAHQPCNCGGGCQCRSTAACRGLAALAVLGSVGVKAARRAAAE